MPRRSPHFYEEITDDALALYLQRIVRISLLPKERELELAKRIQEGDEQALRALVEANLRFVVKVPRGMVEADLARPVIEVVDFETSEVEFEVYTYGEQVVVMAVETPRKRKARASQEKIAKEIGKLVKDFRIDVSGDTAVVHVAEADAPLLLGKEGKVLARIEEKLEVPIDVRVTKRTKPRPEFVPEIEETDRHMVLRLDDLTGKQVGVYVNGELLFNATVGRKGDIRITKDSPDIARIRGAREKKEQVLVRPATG